MDTVEEAFKFFFKTGRFSLFYSELSITQLQRIKKYIQSFPMNSYEIYLHDVDLVSFHTEELVALQGAKSTVLSGGLTEAELPALLKSQPDSEASTLRILNYREHVELSLRGNYTYAYEAIEKLLLNLFEISQWKVIKLENIRIIEKEESKPLTFQFIAELFDIFLPYADCIKALSLKKVDLFNRNILVNFLKKASQLEFLGLEDIQCENNFRSHNTPNNLINRLCETLSYHPCLQQLDLRDTPLNEADYEELFTLLNNNYCLDTLLLKPPPPFGLLSQLHGQLIQEMEERIKKSALVRFQENQLTQTNLGKLAEWSLTLDEFHPIRLNYDQTSKEIAITHASNLKFSKTLIKDLPLGLCHYPELLQKSFPIPLNLSQVVDNQRTLGARLLAKAFQLRKPRTMQLLLVAGADLLEKLPYQPSLIATIFSDKEEQVYKQIILEHVKKDLSVFVPFITRLLPRYEKIDDGLKKIKYHLDEFITTLLELDQLPFLLKLFQSIGLETKKENWEKDFRLIVQAAQAGTRNAPIIYSRLSDFEAIIQILYHEAARAKKQWFSGYQFNRKLLESLDQLLQSTRDYQKILFRAWEQQEGGVLVKNAHLKEELKNANETIVQMKAMHIQALADLTAHYEAKGKKDLTELPVAYEAQNAAMEARIARIESVIVRLLQLQPSPPTVDISSRASPNPRFFSPR